MSFTPFQLSTFITAFVSFFLGISVYSRERKSRVNLFWFLTSLSISLWSVGLFGVVFSKNEGNAWFWQHILDIGGIIIPIFYFNFILYLLKKELFRLRILTGITGLILVALSFTRLFKIGVSLKFNLNYWVDPGKLYFLFPLTFVLFVIIATVFIIKEYRISSSPVFKKQLKNFLFAQIFGFGGGVTNFFPQFFNLYPFGNYLVILYVIFVSYAAIRHQLFNIRIIATEMLVFAIWVFLLARTALSENYNDLIINLGLVVMVITFGILLIRSVNKEVRQREKMEHMAKELERAYEVEKNARVQIQELSEAKTQFIMATQHHLRTPLTSMRGYVDLILTGSYGKVPTKIKEAISKLQISTVRLLRVVNELLDVSQFQLGKKVVTLQPGVEIEPILKEVVEELRFTAESKGLYLKFKELEGKMPAIQADVEKLKVALFNLIDNGIKYTSKGGVTVRAEVSDSKVRIMSKDTGIGISKERLGALFDSTFERGKEAKKVFSAGRGIGLYVSSQIIRAHNGRVWAESEGEGKGTTFCLELPIN